MEHAGESKVGLSPPRGELGRSSDLRDDIGAGRAQRPAHPRV